MKKLSQILLLGTLLVIFLSPSIRAQEEQGVQKNETEKLVVVWTSGDIEVAEKMVFMYVYNAKKAGWFDEVTFIIWGPSAKLLSENEKLQENLAKMQEIGIKTEACISCARMYGVVDKLKELGVDVKGMGVPLSDYIKKGNKVLTF